MKTSLLPEVRDHFSLSREDYVTWRSPNLLNPDGVKDGKVLEVGCGAKFSFETPMQKFGVDITPCLLHELKNLNPDVEVVLADARFLPFKSKTFSTIGAVFVLHHLVGNSATISVTNIVSSMSEMKRALNDQGRILILEHLTLNRIVSLLFFQVTWILAKLKINIKYLDIHDRVVTFFLDENGFNRICKRIGLTHTVIQVEKWQFRKVKLGYDKQLLLQKRIFR